MDAVAYQGLRYSLKGILFGMRSVCQCLGGMGWVMVGLDGLGRSSAILYKEDIFSGFQFA